MRQVDQSVPARTGWNPLDITVDLTRVRAEAVAWVALLVAAAGLRLAGLASAALDPAAARQAYAAYGLYYGSGAGLGSGAAAPFPTIFTTLLFFLFGVSDEIARLAPALAGLGIVALAALTRPYLGSAGALGAGALLALSPTMVYFSRQPVPTIYATFFALLLFIAWSRALERGGRGDVVLAAVAAALLALCGPTGLTLLVALGLLFAVKRAGSRARGAGPGGQDDDGMAAPSTSRGSTALYAILAALATLALGFSAFGAAPENLWAGPIALARDWGTSLFAAAPGRGPTFALGLLLLYEPLLLITALGALVSPGATGSSLLSAPRSPRAVLAVWVLLGAILLALGGATRPELVLLPVLPLALLGGMALGDLGAALTRRESPAPWGRLLLLVLGVLLALAAWAAAAGLAIQAGTRSGDARWVLDLALTVVALAVPATLVATWYARALPAGVTRHGLLLAGLALVTLYGVRTAVELGVYRGDSAREPLVYQASTPAVLPLVERLRRLSRDLTATARNTADPTGGHGLSIAIDPAVEWPMRWYFRDFPALVIGGGNAMYTGPRPPQLVFRPAGAPALPSGAYTEQRYKLQWSYPAGQPLTGERDPLLRALGFLLFRQNVPDAPSTDLVVGYAPDLAARLFPPPAAQGPFALGDQAGLGRAPGQFDAPRGVAVAPDGAIYVVDMRNARVERFNPDGSFARQFGGLGRGDGQFWREAGRGPTGIAIDSAGFVYVADTWNHRVEKFTADGVFVAKWGVFSNLVTGAPGGNRAGFYGPRGIAISAAGEVFVTDTGNARVVVFDSTGKFLREFGSKGVATNQLNEPVGIAVSPDGQRVYVADSGNGRIAVFDGQGQPVAQWPVDAWRGKAYFEPYLALAPDGTLYATSSATRQVLKFGPDGRLVLASSGTAPDQTLAAPVGIALAADGSLYVSDTTRNSVLRLTMAR